MVNDSFERVLEVRQDEKSFFDLFYDHFIAQSTEIQEKFNNTDFTRQKRMLRKSLVVAIDFYASRQETPFLEELAAIHSRRQKDIRPELYYLWLDSLLATLRGYDPRFNDDVEEAWRWALSPIIDYFQSQYEV